ncbi:MAG: hypothetical protein Q7R88_02355, partial [bacterium]|nr:hypothetical protein [bacterium]
GENISVTVSVNSQGNSINTVSGKVVVPSTFSIREVRHGNSVISLWVEQPKIQPDNTVTFAGGIPGGFNSTGPLFTLYVSKASAGEGTVRLSDVKVLLNDGLGTEAAATMGSLSLTIKAAAAKPAPAPATKPKATTEQPKAAEQTPLPKDEVAPEAFAPLISRHESIAENKYFVSFFAVDKDSGIDRYEVREGYRMPPFSGGFGWSEWEKAKTPYVLKRQILPTEVQVRAFDGKSNVAEGATKKPLSPGLTVLLTLVLMGLAALSTYVRLRRRPSRKR